MVEIPDDVAKRMAAWMRDEVAFTPSGYSREWLDLLDPQPDLGHKVDAAIIAGYREGYRSGLTPDECTATVRRQVLAVVKTELDALARGGAAGTARRLYASDIDALFGGAS